MEKKFTSSEGIEITPWGLGIRVGVMQISTRYVRALAELFQHLRDEERGRWRSKGASKFTVIERSANQLWMVNDYEPWAPTCFNRETCWGNDDVRKKVAEEFFASIDPPKPWKEAEQGEFWEITCQGVPYRAIVGARGFILETGLHLEVDDPRITAGTRLWPLETF